MNSLQLFSLKQACRNAFVQSSSIAASSLKAENIVSNPQSTSFTFNMTGIKNPGSLMPNSQLGIQFYNSLSQKMAECSITIDGSTATTITNLDFAIQHEDQSRVMELGVNGKGILKFTVTEAPQLTDVLQITFPTNFDLR